MAEKPNSRADFGPFGLVDQGLEHGVLQDVDLLFPILQTGVQIRKVDGNGGIEQTSWSHLNFRLDTIPGFLPADRYTKLLKNPKGATTSA